MQVIFFFLQNTVNAETLYVYRMLESILEKNLSINSIVDIATFFLNVSLAEVHVRHKRLTCQLGTVQIMGNAAGNFGCYLHCVARRRKGGYCNAKSICICTG